MISNSKLVEEIKVTEKELELILAVRRKFKGCECCVEKIVEFVDCIEKKN